VDKERGADEAVHEVPVDDKEEAAWANVGAVNPSTGSGTATDDSPAPEPEKEEAPAEQVTHVPDETEPVEEDAREEEAEAADTEAKSDIPEGEIVAVEDAPSAEPVSEDSAPLSDANPSGAELSEVAGHVADVDTHGQATDDDAVEEWLEEGGTPKSDDDDTKP
jgi:hypothetical protein